jgi:hypothetical protein
MCHSPILVISNLPQLSEMLTQAMFHGRGVAKTKSEEINDRPHETGGRTPKHQANGYNTKNHKSTMSTITTMLSFSINLIQQT